MNTPSQQSIKIMTVKPCTGIRGLQSSPAAYKAHVQSESYYRYSGDPCKMKIYEYAIKKLKEAKAQDEETHKLNIEALENNKIIKGSIVSLMKSLGIPDTYKERKESRSRTPKYETREAA